ncbi:hypothetical protein ACMU_18450 [Actibacterium mucosum KCTC 23349]|uniref:Mandelate racemase/muconate lactonizing enzyme C-terminal domain-containing protein n=1 Tax=Actibacterium mucosum KCTC 23349 TaxID=1454373 RepID=A0A037ZD82_9RHOB|nr:enolase C-terminal domain-like protein [Actibacterium mucosum]KAJ54409.1 hypothetical protein ACMU_18450 [Actibacterium mucosum KCTC 23349]
MPDRVVSVDIFLFERPRDTPYLGGVGADETMIDTRYVVRGFNGTVYPLNDRSLVVRVRTAGGVEGWGETYGLIAPKATAAIIADLLGPYLCTLQLGHPAAAWQSLYDLQRNRGYWGGYYADALAALDIALWDIYAQNMGQSLQAAMGRPGGGRLPGYISGLPADTGAARLDMAQHWAAQGFDALKIPISATDDGDVVGEFARLRAGLGADHKIALDMHWAFAPQDAIALAADLAVHDPWFLEAPVAPEDIAAQVAVAKGIEAPLALGEEWRTDWDYAPRAGHGIPAILQPEMGHTGITQFQAIAKRGAANNAQLIPHATIGLGIFMAASLRASLACGATCHEFQHSVYGRNAALLEGSAPCEAGHFIIGDSPGLGVKPTAEAFEMLSKIEI